MNDAAWISAIGTLIYDALMLVSLLLIWSQIRSLKGQLKSSALQGVWVIWIEIDKWFVAHPELKPYFYHGKDIDDTKVNDYPNGENLKHQLDSTAEMLLDCFANFYHQKDCMSAKEEEAYQKFMQDVYKHQPYFQRFVKERKGWYYPQFIQYLTEGKNDAEIIEVSRENTIPV